MLIEDNKRQQNPQKSKFSLLLVDDEERILSFLDIKLKLSGYSVTTAANGIIALEQIQEQEFDLIVLDVMMPEKDGFETLKELRSFSSIPVIMLSARGDDLDRIKGFQLGADDYIPKPFNADELIVRIEAIRKRTGLVQTKKNSKKLILQGVNIDFEKRRITVRGKEVKLTRIEWLLLHELAANAGHLVTYQELLGEIRGNEYFNDVQSLKTWISKLAQKIEIDPNHPKIINMDSQTGFVFYKQ